MGWAISHRKRGGPGKFQEQKQERVQAEHSEGQGRENQGGDTCPTPTADTAKSYNDVGQCKDQERGGDADVILDGAFFVEGVAVGTFDGEYLVDEVRGPSQAKQQEERPDSGLRSPRRIARGQVARCLGSHGRKIAFGVRGCEIEIRWRH